MVYSLLLQFCKCGQNNDHDFIVPFLVLTPQLFVLHVYVKFIHVIVHVVLILDVLQEHSYCFESDQHLKRKVFDLQDRISSLQKKARNAELRESRAKKTCSTYLAELKEKNLLTTELEEKLSRYQGVTNNNITRRLRLGIFL